MLRPSRPSARSDGKPQVTYHGHPLYFFSGDQNPGDANGQGVNTFGGLWYVLSSSVNEITTSAGSGGGLGYWSTREVGREQRPRRAVSFNVAKVYSDGTRAVSGFDLDHLRRAARVQVPRTSIDCIALVNSTLRQLVGQDSPHREARRI
jgi:hypothetical protein